MLRATARRHLRPTRADGTGNCRRTTSGRPRSGWHAGLFRTALWCLGAEKSALGGQPVRVFDEDWDDFGAVASLEATGEIVIEPRGLRGPGAERGFASSARFDAVELAFEVRISASACFLAKIHQADRLEQTTNSYHLLCDERRAYIARHHHVFRHLELARDTWQHVRLSCVDGAISLYLDDRLVHRVRDRTLAGGYAFLGAQGGPVRLRGVRLTALEAPRTAGTQTGSDVEVMQTVAAPQARVSIITTVYDRTECLRQCIGSVQRLTFRDYEHLIVSDCPPSEDVQRIRTMVAAARDERIGYFNLARRHNNWGIAPAAAGLRCTRGEYVCFLSDDNGYMPDHIGISDPRARSRTCTRLRVQLVPVRWEARAAAPCPAARMHRSRTAAVPPRAVRTASRRRSAIRHDGVGLASDRNADGARRPLEARRQAKLHLPARKVSPAIGWVGADLTAILGSG